MPTDDFAPDEIVTHRALLALDRTPGPRAGFVAGLRADLLRDHPSAPRQEVAGRAYPGVRSRGRYGGGIARRGYLDALAAVLVLGMVAALAAAIGRSDETPYGARVGTPAPAPAAGVGMLFGDAGRTGAAPGPLPEGVPGLVWEAAGSETMYDGVSPPVVVDGVIYAVRRKVVSALENSGTVEALFPGFSVVVALDLDTSAVLWETTITDLFQAPAVAVAGGLVFVATERLDRALIALDGETGAERWAYDASGVGSTGGWYGYTGLQGEAPAVADGVVYFGGWSGALHAVDATSGERRWAVAIPSPALAAVAGGMVYVADNRGMLHAFDVETGAERWTAEIGGNSATTPVVAGGSVYIGASEIPGGMAQSSGSASTGGVESADAGRASTGLVVEAFPTPPPGSEPGSEPVHRLVALDAVDGARRWTYELDQPIVAAPTVSGDVVAIVGAGSGGREVVALGATAGDWKWTAEFPGRVPAPGAVVGDTLVFAAYATYDVIDAGALYALAADSGAVRWRVAMPSASTGPPAVADGMVVVSTQDGLMAFGAGADLDGTPPTSPDGSTLTTCPVTPYTTTGPDPAFTYLWYGEGKLMAGNYPDSWGVWYADAEGPKVHWFRPRGAALTVEGQRLDGEAPPLAVRLPEGYETQAFQVSRLIFPTAGCWEVVGRTEGAELRFVVDVRPGEQYRAATPVPDADWESLERRPELPVSVPAGDCPVSPVGTSGRVEGAVLGDGLVRVQGLGDGTVDLARGADGSPAGIPVYLVVDPGATGPLLIRTFARGEDGASGFGPDGGQTEIRQEGRGNAIPADWLVIRAEVAVTGAGCYALQVDGPSLGEAVVFEVVEEVGTLVAARMW